MERGEVLTRVRARLGEREGVDDEVTRLVSRVHRVPAPPADIILRTSQSKTYYLITRFHVAIFF